MSMRNESHKVVTVLGISFQYTLLGVRRKVPIARLELGLWIYLVIITVLVATNVALGMGVIENVIVYLSNIAPPAGLLVYYRSLRNHGVALISVGVFGEVVRHAIFGRGVFDNPSFWILLVLLLYYLLRGD